MNPNVLAIMWGLTVLMAGAIALGPVAILVVASLVAAYTIFVMI